MMRIFTWCLLLCCACSLTACLGLGRGNDGGGGGGGGAGGSGLTPAGDMYKSVAVAKANPVIGGQGTDTNAGIDGGIQVGQVGDDALKLDSSGSFKVATKDGSKSFTIPDSQVVQLANGMLKATLPTNDSTFQAFVAAVQHDDLPVPGNYDNQHLGTDMNGNEEYFTGTLKYEGDMSLVALGKNENGFSLEHSSFGAWAVNTETKGTFWEEKNGSTVKPPINQTIKEVFFIPISDRVDTAKNMTPAAGEFSGPIVAMAYKAHIDGDENSFKNFFIDGTAKLSVAGANKINGVTLELPGFYNITYANGNNGFVIENGGKFGIDEQWGSKPTFTPNNTRAGFEMTEIRQHDLKGQFYGDAPGAGSEATGRFKIVGIDANDGDLANRQVGVSGAFGVKK